MDLFNSAFDAVLQFYFAAFSWAPPALGLAVLSAAVGVGMLWVFHKTSDQAGMKAVKRRIYAALLEMRVFADEPAVTWRAQKSLFAANLRYMGLALRPALWMLLPVALLLIHLEAFYSRAPLPLGREAIVTMRMAPAWNPQAPAPLLSAPAEIAIETPPVRVASVREVSWRIRPVTSASTRLQFTVDGQTIAKGIETGPVQRFVAARRVSSMLETLWNPAEPRIDSKTVEWIDISYPEAALLIFGFRTDWLILFLVVSMVAALLLKKRFGVVL